MAKTLKEVERPVAVAQVVKHGEKLIVPEQMTLESAVDLLLRRMEFEEQEITLHEPYPVFPWDGANALDAVLQEKFGWSPSQPTVIQGLFGPSITPPKLISVEVAFGVKKQIPWGTFALFGTDEGEIVCGSHVENGQLVFMLHAKVKRKDERMVREIFEGVREYLKTGSIYRGKALKLRFRGDDGDTLEMPQVSFVDLSSIREERLVFSRHLHASIETNLFTPIRRVRELADNGLPIKRTVLFGGIYGTGKTLASAVASKIAVENGVTHLYVPRADELADALKFAAQYNDPACVVFCEDIDRVMRGERSVEMDDLLNIIDGADTKNARIITVLTSNEVEKIHAAMLRNGRLDAVIEITPPDAEAVERLIRLYGGGEIRPDTTLERIGRSLDGHIPATIAEVVKRAKLSQLKLNRVGQIVEEVTEDALLDAVGSMAYQLDLLAVKSRIPTTTEKTIDDLVKDQVHDVLTNGAGNVIVEKCINEMGRVFGFERA